MNGPLASASESFQNSFDAAGGSPASGDQGAAPAAEETIGGSESAQESAAQDQAAIEEMMDLDSVEKFKFQGKDWTPEELHRAIMRQSDYTKKTQEIAEERKFISNLQYDLQLVKRDPRLADEFRKTYPEKYHAYLDVVLEQAEAQGQVPAQNGADQNLPPDIQKIVENAVKQRLDPIERRFSEADHKAQEAQIAVQEKELDQLFGNLANKYEFGVEESVMAKAESMIQNGYKVTPTVLERLWKASHQANLAKAEKWHNSKVKTQLQKNQEGGDIGRGGGTPAGGTKRMNLSQATEAMIASLSKQT